MTDRADEAVSALLAEANNVFEVVIAWKPGARPVTFFFVKLDGVPLTKNQLDTESPFTLKLPPSFVGKKAKLAWSIAPEVDVEIMAIGLQKRGRAGATKIAANEKGIKRGDIWDDEASFTVE